MLLLGVLMLLLGGVDATVGGVDANTGGVDATAGVLMLVLGVLMLLSPTRPLYLLLLLMIFGHNFEYRPHEHNSKCALIKVLWTD